MDSVGIDLHRNRSHISAIDGEGTEVLSRRIANDPAPFLELLGGLEDRTRIAVEATYGWEWLADVLEGSAAASSSPSSRCARSRAAAWARCCR